MSEQAGKQAEKPKFVFGVTTRTKTSGRATGGGKLKFGARSSAPAVRFGTFGIPPINKSDIPSSVVGKMVFGETTEEFLENLVLMASGSAGKVGLEMGKHGLRGILSGLEDNGVSGDWKQKVVEKMAEEAKTSKYSAYHLVDGLYLVVGSDDLVLNVWKAMKESAISAEYAGRALLGRSLGEVPEKIEKDLVVFDEEAFFGVVAKMVIGECGSEMEEIGRQCVRGILFGGEDNPIGAEAKNRLVQCLVEKVVDEEIGKKVVSTFCLVGKNDELVEKGLEEMTAKEGCGRAVMKVLGREVEYLLGVSRMDRNSILDALERESGLDVAKEAIRTSKGAKRYVEAVERCLLSAELWQDVVEVFGRGREPSVGTMVELVSEGEHWRDVFLWYVPSMGVEWGLGKREGVLEALEGSWGSSPFNEKVLDAGVEDGVEWVELTEEAKRLVRGCIGDSKRRHKFEMMKQRLLQSEENEGEKLHGCAMRELYWNGLHGRVLARKGSGILKVLDIGDLVGEIEGFLWDTATRYRRDCEETRARALQRKWVQVHPKQDPPLEWWIAYGGDVERLDRVISRKRKKGEEVDMQAILYAATAGESLETARYALENGGEANSERLGSRYILDHGSSPPLVVAGGRGSEELVRLLLDGGADVNRANDYGCTPLFMAAQEGHESICRMLLDGGAEVDQADDGGCTPLFTAAENGQESICRMLLDGGAEVDRARYDGCTPLFIAAEKGHDSICRMLLDGGAEVDRARYDGCTPLFIAAENGHDSICRMLLDGGADVNRANKDGKTPLYVAAQNGHESVCRLLLEAGAEVDRADDYGKTPLYVAAEKGRESICRMLLEGGAEVNRATNFRSTPLWTAAQKGHESVCRMLLDAGAEVDRADKNGKTPLLVAVEKGHDSICRMLLDAGAEVNRAGYDGCTPLWTAAEKGHESVCRMLLDAGAEVDRADTDGKTPLWTAAQKGHESVCRLLLDAGAEVDQADKDGKTPLLAAVENDHESICRMLLDAGAEVDRADRNGKTPVTEATRRSRYLPNIFLLFQKHKTP